MKKTKYIFQAGLLILAALLYACEQDPVIADQTTTELNDISDFRTNINGAYELMRDFHYYGRNYIIGVGEVRADNVYSNRHTSRFGNYSVMDVNPTPDRDDDYIFDQIYASIANPNLIIHSDLENIAGDISEEDERNDFYHIVGEAYTLRALTHFDLLRGWGQQYSGGDLGISYATEFKPDDLNVHRGTTEENRAQLNSDLEKAIDFLTQGQNSAREADKTHISLDAARALQYRIAIYFRDYETLRKDAKNIEDIIERYPITPAENLTRYWSQDEPGEASIFELYISSSETNGNNSIGSIFRGANNYGDIQAFNNLIEDAELDPDDIRAQPEMIAFDSGNALRNMGKYPDNKNGTDNIKIFRIEEVVLNYAEALVETEPLKALNLLNSIPAHRHAEEYPIGNSEALYNDILKERRKEFLFEGFRFFDLARFQLPIREVDPAVLTHEEIQPGDYRLALPIPIREIDTNNETVQNPGY